MIIHCNTTAHTFLIHTKIIFLQKEAVWEGLDIQMIQYLNLSKNEKVYRLKTTKNVEVFFHFLFKKTELYVVKFLSILS